MLDLEAIKGRIASASPGPWRFTESAGPFIYARKGHMQGWVARAGEVYMDRGERMANAALIANAPADLAALVEEVERLRNRASYWEQLAEGHIAEGDRLREELDMARGGAKREREEKERLREVIADVWRWIEDGAPEGWRDDMRRMTAAELNIKGGQSNPPSSEGTNQND